MAKKKITDLIEEMTGAFLEENGLELYHTEFVKEGKDWFLRIYIDKANASADEYVSPETSNTLVSYVAVPTDAKPGSYCYKMLLDPQTSTLYYFRKHKISKKWGPGFLAEDIKRVTAPRTKK